VFAEIRRDARRGVRPGIRQRAETFRALNALLDLPHAGEILIELFLIAFAKLTLQRARIIHHEIKE
jgi:hypothetical protein